MTIFASKKQDDLPQSHNHLVLRIPEMDDDLGNFVGGESCLVKGGSFTVWAMLAVDLLSSLHLSELLVFHAFHECIVDAPYRFPAHPYPWLSFTGFAFGKFGRLSLVQALIKCID